MHSKDCRNSCGRVVLTFQPRLSIMLVTCDREIVEEDEAEKEERDDGEMDNIELDDLSDSDDELWLICFVLLNDVIYCHSKLTHDTCLAIRTPNVTIVKASNTI